MRVPSIVTALLTAAIVGAVATPSGAKPPTLGNGISVQPDLSASGRFVFFASTATNLAPADTNGVQDVFIRDRVAGTTRLVSRGTAGTTANGPSSHPVVSDDGRYVAFLSDATNLVPGDSARMPGAFRADLRTGAIIRVSVSVAGQPADSWCSDVAMTADGAEVLFSTRASNLVPSDTNRSSDVFLRDIAGARTTRVSLTGSGQQRSDRSDEADISPDGRLVAFASTGATASGPGINQWSRATNAVSLVHSDTNIEGYQDYSHEPKASNSGISFTRWWHKDAAQMSGWAVSVRRASGTFRIADDSRGGLLSFTGYDIDRVGRRAVVSVSDGRDGYLHIVEKTLSPPSITGALASLRASGRHPSLAGTSPVVAYADVPTRQIMVWNWQTGSVTPASVG